METSLFRRSSSFLLALDPTVAFQQRARQCQISHNQVQALARSGIDSFAKYAFCCPYHPGSPDHQPPFDFLEAVLGEKPPGADASNFRRMFLEARAMGVQDLKSRLERTDASETKIFPLSEKLSE